MEEVVQGTRRIAPLFCSVACLLSCSGECCQLKQETNFTKCCDTGKSEPCSFPVVCSILFNSRFYQNIFSFLFACPFQFSDILSSSLNFFFFCNCDRTKKASNFRILSLTNLLYYKFVTIDLNTY